MATKFVFVTGGVLSSLGKGLASASLGSLLESRGFKVTLLKLKSQTSKMRGEAYVDNQLVAEAELLATVVGKRRA